MIWWTIVAAALIGWAASGFETAGLVLGGLVGIPMGRWLLNLVRAEAARLIAAQGAVPAQPLQERAEPVVELAEPPRPAPRTAEPVLELEAEPEIPARPIREPAAVPLAQTAAPQEVYEPSAFASATDDLIAKARDWLLGGNTIVRLGLTILFIGLVFLARLVARAGLFPIEARLATVGAAGAALLALGFNRRHVKPAFALATQGTGVAVLYLTVFAAARLFSVLPPSAAFAFMILFAALGCALAVMQDSLGFALAAFVGGYAVPILLGGHAETPTGLFTYYTVLNLAVMGIAWKKSWRVLNLLGFFATFGLASVWGMTTYEDRFYLIVQLFLAASIAIYLVTALLYAHNTPGKLGNFADSTLLFGTALAGFGLQLGLVHDRPYASAWSALAFGAVYLGVTAWTFSKKRPEMRLLNECLLAIGVGFVTLAIPLALEVRWTSAAWALEGAGAFWVGMRQARWMPRAFGLLLQALAALICLTTLEPNVSAVPLINNGFIGPMLIALPLLITAWWLRGDLAHSGSHLAKSWRQTERNLGHPWFLGGFLFTAIALASELLRSLPAANADDWPVPVLSDWQLAIAMMLAALALMSLSDWLGRARDWAVATWPARLSLLVLSIGFLASMANGRHVLTWPDVLAWIAALALHARLLFRQDRGEAEHPSTWNRGVHAIGALLGVGLVADSLFLGIDRASLWNSSWAGVAFLVAATAVLAGLTRWAGRAAATGAQGQRWPLDPHAYSYWWLAGCAVAVITWIGAVATAWNAEGITDPLPYLPLINPVDLSVGLAVAALMLWGRMVDGAKDKPPAEQTLTGKPGIAAMALLGFVWINAMWLRAAHHFMGIAWNSADLFASPEVQAGLSILWTLMAMALMIYAHRHARRGHWLTGAVLLGVVVAKLLLIDMAQVQGFARIASFIAVGLIMLAIGYFVPLPPRAEEKA